MDSSSCTRNNIRGLGPCSKEVDNTASMDLAPKRRLHNSDPSTSRSLRLWLLLASSALMITQVAGAQGLNEVFVMRLYGTNEIGHPGDPNGSGEARLNFDSSSNTCFFEINLSGTSEPTHIGILHGGPLETSGSGLHEESVTMVALMSAGTRVQSAGYGRYHLSGSASAPDYIIADITSKPSGCYVQVWTEEYEYGAVRAQLQDENSGVAVTYSDSTLDNWSGNATDAAKAAAISAATDPSWEASVVASQTKGPTAAQIQNPMVNDARSQATPVTSASDSGYFIPSSLDHSARVVAPDRYRRGLTRYTP